MGVPVRWWPAGDGGAAAPKVLTSLFEFFFTSFGNPLHPLLTSQHKIRHGCMQIYETKIEESENETLTLYLLRFVSDLLSFLLLRFGSASASSFPLCARLSFDPFLFLPVFHDFGYCRVLCFSLYRRCMYVVILNLYS